MKSFQVLYSQFKTLSVRGNHTVAYILEYPIPLSMIGLGKTSRLNAYLYCLSYQTQWTVNSLVSVFM